MFRFLKFLYCCFMGHDWRTINLPPNRRIQIVAKCNHCGHLFWQLGPKE